MALSDRQAAALVAAGRLLQSPRWTGGAVVIARAPGETYPQAVARAIAALDADTRVRLRELVAWVLDYDLAVGTMEGHNVHQISHGRHKENKSWVTPRK